jgi:PAS domain S-box-containing protein
MIHLDMHTVLLSYALSNAVCAAVMTFLWLSNRRRSPGLGFWLADFILQFIAIVLVALRGVIPVPVSILLGSPLAVAGTLLLYVGLECYTGKTSPQRFNYLLFTGYAIVHTYFAFVQPNLLARNINFSVALLAICSQCAWLMLRRVDPEIRAEARLVGVIFVAYSLFSLARVLTYLVVPPGVDLFTSSPNDVLVILLYQVLFVGLTFSLFLMVNRHLVGALELDIIERQRAGEMQDWLASFPTLNPMPIVEVDRAGSVKYLNPAAERLFPDLRQTGLGHPWLAGYQELEQACRASGTNVCVREVCVDGDWYQQMVDYVPTSQSLRIYGFDITERKRAEEARAYLASIVESSDDAIIGKSTEGVIRSWNLGAERLYGYTRSEVLGKSVFILVPRERHEEAADFLNRVRQGVAIEHHETIRITKAGERINVSVTISPLRSTSGEITGASTVARDISARKRAEDEIQKLNEQLEQRVIERTRELEASNKELEAFTYSVSHDLRAPLRHVDGFSKLLVEKHSANLAPDAQDYVAMIRDSAVQMGRLIDDLLNFARLGRKQLGMQVTGLGSLVEDVTGDLKRANPDRLIEWKAETLPFVECDPGLMKQVFANLLSNAVKFTRPRTPALIEVGVISQNCARAVFVRDNGVGFSMKYVHKLFGVFQRLHRSEDFEGTGVGLATVQRIIHKLGGRVWAEAELDKGATFYFTLGSSEDHRAADGVPGPSDVKAA